MVETNTPRRSAQRRRNMMIRLAAYQDNRCFHCGEPLEFLDPKERHANHIGNRPNVASFDHVMPRSLGGSSRIDNFVVAHRDCNSIRGNRVPTQDELDRLAVLNVKRKDEIAHIRHVIDASSFGIETPASLFLVDLLTDLDGRDAVRTRRVVSSILSRLNMDLAAIDQIKPNSQWVRIANLIRDDAFRRAQDIQGPIGTTTRSVILAIMNERMLRKGIINPVKDRLRQIRKQGRSEVTVAISSMQEAVFVTSGG